MVDPNRRRMFATLVAAALVDGRLSDDERLVLHRKATEMDIPVSVVREMLSQKGLSVAVPPGREGRERLLDDLIDVACADGRLEPPEHHLLAKFASHLGLGLPDLRARVRARMEIRNRGGGPPPPEPRREAPAFVPEPPALKLSEAHASGPVPPPPSPAPPPAILPPLPGEAPPDLADVPPVTLALIRQNILFEKKEESLRYIERMLGLSSAQAERLYQAVCAAFPDVQPASRQIQAFRK